MRVISNQDCGFAADGSVLLKKGSNDLREPLVASERAFVEMMVEAKIATVVSEVEPAPISETKIKVPAKVFTQGEHPKKVLRTRKAAK